MASTAVTDRIVEKVATETNTAQLDLPPLFEAADPDALETIVQTMTDGEISFAYAGTTVSVHSSGTIRVAKAPSAEEADTQSLDTEVCD